MLYGFAAEACSIEAVPLDGVGGVDGTVDVALEAFAIPRKCLNVAGRGRPIGLRKDKDIGERLTTTREVGDIVSSFPPAEVERSRTAREGKASEKAR